MMRAFTGKHFCILINNADKYEYECIFDLKNSLSFKNRLNSLNSFVVLSHQ